MGLWVWADDGEGGEVGVVRARDGCACEVVGERWTEGRSCGNKHTTRDALFFFALLTGSLWQVRYIKSS